MKYSTRTGCRCCNSKDLIKCLTLTPTPPADSYVEKEKLHIHQDVIPLELYLCNHCGLTQIRDIIDTEEVYLNYTYVTKSSLGLNTHFKILADSIDNEFKFETGNLVIDIGSNDGTLLRFFKEKGYTVLGIDPAPDIAEQATKNGILTLPKFFDIDQASYVKDTHGKAVIVTCNNLVADVDDLNGLLNGINLLLEDDGIFVFESFYLVDQIENFVWDFTYHEHFSYFTVKPLVSFLKSINLELFDVQRVGTKGGSLRYFIQKLNGPRAKTNSIDEFIGYEEKIEIHKPNIFNDYQNRIESSKSEFIAYIKEIDKPGITIGAYGASATSTTLIYHYEMGEYLKYIYDDFDTKQGLYSPGYHIPVYHPDKIYDHMPDFIIILAWRYYENIVSNHKKYIENGGKFIIPLPTIKLIQ
ncbi:class I SAM-dependent methyltransferase [Pseudomonadota bacterium]